MGRINSVLFTSDVIAKKPAWFQRQVAAITAPATDATARLDPAPSPKPKPASVDAQIQHPQIEAWYPGRVLVRATSYRCGVQCDPDNIIVKWHIDAALRYSGIISDDSNREISLEVKEVRVPTKAEEGVLIEITPI